MKVAMIVAMAENRVIGRNNQLPWYLPNDLKYFKQVTLGKPVIMGRKTFDSIGKPLPGRLNLVVTRQTDWQFEGVKVAHSLTDALHIGRAAAEFDGVTEVMLIGGAQLYAEALPLADRLYLTEVHAEVAGDAWFPEFDKAQWQEQARQSFAAEGPNPYDYSFVVYDRV